MYNQGNKYVIYNIKRKYKNQLNCFDVAEINLIINIKQLLVLPHTLILYKCVITVHH
jgi:hypothetical protein